MPARGRPRLAVSASTKTWMAGTSPAMTESAIQREAITRSDLALQAAVDLAGIALVDLLLVGGAEPGHLVDVALGVVIMVAGARIDALHGSDHLRGEQDVVDRDDFGEQLDARQVIHAGVEIDILEQQLLERRPLHVLRQAPVPAPVIRHRAAAMRDDEFERRKILEQVRRDELHEGGGVAV